MTRMVDEVEERWHVVLALQPDALKNGRERVFHAIFITNANEPV